MEALLRRLEALLRCLSVHVHGECLNHAAIDTVEFFDLQGEASCLLVDLFDGSHLLADAFEVEVVGFVDGCPDDSSDGYSDRYPKGFCWVLF